MSLKFYWPLLGFLLWLNPSHAGAQTITDFFPRVGTTNDTVVVTGSGFLPSGNSVTFQFWNRKTAAKFVNSGSQATITVPANVTTGPISVYKTTGATVTNFSAQNFLVIGREPYVTSLSTNAATVGDNITIRGVHFFSPVGVRFTGATATEVTPDAGGSNMVVRVPSGATNGPIVVTNTYGSFTNTATFIVVGPGPYIGSFSPTNGDSSTLVTIIGWHFIGATVFFNGVQGAINTSADAQITVHPPAGVATGPISVRVSGLGTNTTSDLFYAPPSITGFSPTNGIAGTTVTLRGQNFLGATSVQFGGVEVSSPFYATNNTNLVVKVPAGAPSGLIRVQTPGGAQFSGTAFRMLPTITGFTPVRGRQGTNVTIFGANLNEGLSAVKFNGTNGAIVGSPSFSQATATVPVTTTGPITVTTTNGTASSGTNFYLPPQITGFTPNNSAPGTTVTLSGQNLIDASAVTFNGAPATLPFPATNNTALPAIVPTNFTTGPIGVVTPYGATNSGALLFYAAPVIDSFTPTHGLPGTNVTISGNNFLGVTGVSFGGAPAAFTPPSENTTLQARVPTNNVFNGPIIVTGPAGSVTSSVPFTLDFASDVAVGLAVSPDLVFVGSNLTYVITVTNLGPFAAPNVTVTNTLPLSVNLHSVSISAGTISTNANRVIGAFGTLGSTAGATLTLVVIPQAIGTISDNAAAASFYSDPVLANNNVTVNTTVYPVPTLSIQLYSPTLVQISWPAMLTNFSLQYSGSLAPGGGWTNVGTPPLVSGDQRIVIDPLDTVPKFYRLKR